ncbi:MAG: hypothetical protein HY855_17320 [Burkholderiales bacterium]|nr:hypothetical protein [Burkholderiales bacterium]
MKPIAWAAFAAGLLALGLAGCGEQPQTGTAGARKSDQKPWQQPMAKDHVVPGLKADDAAAWEQQIRQRAQGQNDYARAPAAARP